MSHSRVIEGRWKGLYAIRENLHKLKSSSFEKTDKRLFMNP